MSGGARRSFNPGIAGAQFGGNFGSMYNSTSADFTAQVWAIDLNLPAPPAANSNTSGCEATDYDGMPDGAIALVQRGTCPFATKFQLAEESGAGGVILFNEGQPGREVPLWFDVDGPADAVHGRLGPDRHGARQRREQRLHRHARPLQDRLAPRYLSRPRT